MQKELVIKITEMLQAIPAHSDWDIEIVLHNIERGEY